MLGLVLHPNAGRPKYRQLCDFLRQAIANRSLPAGSALPSSRTLAEQLGVSRNTVIHAYEELAAQGLVEGRIGSGTTVRQRVSGAPYLFVPNIPDVLTLLRQAHYPAAATGFYDPDGTSLYIHR